MRIAGWLMVAVFLIGFCIPQQFYLPVEEADCNSFHKDSFWYYPWGKSGCHKGVDIFAATHTPVLSATSGFVVFAGHISRGGNVVAILGPKWRIHYYAHLQKMEISIFEVVSGSTRIGTVGTSGNAKGKPPHLHYSIFSIFPYLNRFDATSYQGWLKMFYLNPIDYFNCPWTLQDSN